MIARGQEMTHMHSVVLVKLGGLLDLAHHDDNGRGTAEQALLGSQVILPGGREMREALLEELAVDLDLRHDDDGWERTIRKRVEEESWLKLCDAKENALSR
jgi:hypothetical protein